MKEIIWDLLLWWMFHPSHSTSLGSVQNNGNPCSVFLPHYSPNTMPIELLFSYIKYYLKDHGKQCTILQSFKWHLTVLIPRAVSVPVNIKITEQLSIDNSWLWWLMIKCVRVKLFLYKLIIMKCHKNLLYQKMSFASFLHTGFWLWHYFPLGYATSAADQYTLKIYSFTWRNAHGATAQHQMLSVEYY